MRVPLELSCSNVAKTEDLESLVRKESEKLQRICSHMVSCRVSIERPQKHQRTGSPYRVRVNVRVPPGHDLVAKREAGEGGMHEELASVVRQAFRAMQRQLQGITEKQRGDVKAHEEQQTAAVIERLLPEKDCGFLRTVDGRQVYFHRNSVLHHDFDELEAGAGVAFSEIMGEEGPQASTVRILERTPSKGPSEDEHT